MSKRQKEPGVKRRRARRSRISRRLLGRFVLTMAVYAASLLAFVVAMEFLCSTVIWQPYDRLYRLLTWVRDNIWAFIILLMAAGWIFVTYRYLLVPLGYLDELTAAAEQLAAPTEEPVELSDALDDIQTELNLAREEALRAAMAAKEAEQRKSDLIVYLAHDLKTPLTSVIGYMTLLRDEPQISPELRAKYTGIALDKAERLEELINEFFDITRFNLSHLTLEEETVNLTRMLEQAASEFSPVLAENGLTMDLHLAPDVRIVCDPNKLARVFDNLFRNAVNYAYGGTVVTVTMTAGEDLAAVTVSNRGPTIPPEKLDRVFEQFFRLDQSRGTSGGGAGLGLSIAREITELHGGQITARSADETVTFTVTLPLRRKKIV